MTVTREDLEPTELSDEELTAIALAADPDAPLDPDAVPLTDGRSNGLPASYMPPVARGTLPRSTVRTVAAFAIIAAFLAITGLGFCATYGVLSFA
jgi:hypothetical protein